MTRSSLVILATCVLVTPMLRAQPTPTCEQWNTEEFFGVATVEDVTACLAAGADARARTEDGNTPLHHAAALNEHPEVVEVLLVAGTTVDPRDEWGDTPLMRAAFRVEPRLSLVESLLTAGANPKARNSNGRTALHYAAAVWKGPEIVALLAAGAELMARDVRGQTPLHHAADSRWLRLAEDPSRAVDALLDAGADPLAEDEDGTTPWDLAQQNDKLNGSDAYWRMNDARFDTPKPNVRRGTTTQADRQQAATPPQPQRQGPGCEIPGYPTPANIQSLGVSWCGPSVDFQKRAYALQAAGAWCAIDGGSSSTPEQISARHQEINTACDTLDALQTRLGGRPCQCPSGYRP